MLQSMQSQRVRHNLATQQQQSTDQRNLDVSLGVLKSQLRLKVINCNGINFKIDTYNGYVYS